MCIPLMCSHIIQLLKMNLVHSWLACEGLNERGVHCVCCKCVAELMQKKHNVEWACA